MAKKTVAEKAEKADKTDKASTSGEKGAGDKTPVENTKENDEQPVELGKSCRSSFKLSVKSSQIWTCFRLIITGAMVNSLHHIVYFIYMSK